MGWNSEEIAFAIEAYVSNGCSVFATQRAFQNRFNVAFSRTGNQLLHGSICSDKPRVRQDETNNCPSAHQIT